MPLSPNYIERLNHGGPQGDRVSVTGLRTEDFITHKPHVLLYLLLRHAALGEYASAAFRIQLRRKLLAASDRFEPELVDMDPLHPTSTVWSQLARPVQGLTAVKQSVADYLQGLKNSADPDVAELGEFWDSLAYLQNKPSAILEQLFVETLDLCSHRLDAWVTSFATKRLQTLRQKAPTGIYLGGYGWVENLRPAPARSEVKLLPQGEPPPLYISDSNSGYVHAPSLAHAATAAVLRSGFLSHGPAAENPLAIDLSSRRVRLAISLLEGVRQGQPVGALLGYRFERGLHEGHPGRQLNRYIQPFRELAPLVANKLAQTNEPVEAIAARNVVDGLALHRLWKSGAIPFGTKGLPDPNKTPADYAAVNAELVALDDAIDAVGDTILTESMYHLVQGNPLRSGASLEAVSGGDAPPPELDVARTPRSGVGVTQRILLLFSAEAAPTPAWQTNSRQARAQAEPHLHAWVASLLGDPARVRLRAEYLDPNTSAVLAPPGTLEVRLSELQLSPLDVISMAEGSGETQRSALEQRLIYHLLGKRPPGIPANAGVRLSFPRDRAWPVNDLSVGEFLELVRTARRLVTAARALTAKDLSLPEEAADTRTVVDELEARADAALAQFQQAKDKLPKDQDTAETIDPAGLREALLAIAHFGLQGAIPVSATGSTLQDREMLLAQASSVKREVARRLDRIAAAAKALNPHTATQEEKRGHCLAVFAELFGADFRVLPRFIPQNGAELGLAFGASAPLQGGDPLAAVTWFQRISRVREGAGRLEAALTYAEALGNGANARNGDMRAGLKAQVFDPLWMLARQWQLGEFNGDDAGSPIVARIRAECTSVTRYHPGPWSGGAPATAQSYESGTPLETLVEREPAGANARRATEAGLHFLRLLAASVPDPAAAAEYGRAYLALYALRSPTDEGRRTLEADAVHFLEIVARRVLDGVGLYVDLRAALRPPGNRPGALPPEPAIAQKDRESVTRCANTWLDWYETLLSETKARGSAWG